MSNNIFTQESSEFVDVLQTALAAQASFLEPIIIKQMNDFNIINKEAEVLDVGVGSGQLLCKLSSHFNKFKFTGIDINKKMLNEAKENASKYKQKIEFKHISLFDYKPKKKFDLIISNHAIMFLTKRYPELLQKLTELLNVNGRFFTGDSIGFNSIYPKKINIFKKLLDANHKLIISQGGTINSGIILTSYMERCGFKDINLEIKFLHKYNTNNDKYIKYILAWGKILNKIAPHLFTENNYAELVNIIKNEEKRFGSFLIIPQSYIVATWKG